MSKLQKEICDFFPFDRGLASFVKLAEHPFVGSLNRRIFLAKLPVKALTGNENQTGDPRIFGERDFQRPTDEFRHIKGRIHPPELVQPVRMNSSSGPMSVAPVKRIFVGHRLSRLRLELCEFDKE